ncbi:hypothetical protein [Microcoleus sp. herbarium2]|uniref:hypothetical protein n=1 Tax=Microcoleus sp. herbarium2 TaxID=3055433 RepID=UPI002FD79F93
MMVPTSADVSFPASIASPKSPSMAEATAEDCQPRTSLIFLAKWWAISGGASLAQMAARSV